MASPSYDIFKQVDGSLVWVEAALDLESAMKRSKELARQNGCEYVVFDPRQQQVVVRLNPSIAS
jgi:hypothetical protein